MDIDDLGVLPEGDIWEPLRILVPEINDGHMQVGGGAHTPHRVNTMMKLFRSRLSIQNMESP
jgi:hypothetical protein